MVTHFECNDTISNLNKYRIYFSANKRTIKALRTPSSRAPIHILLYYKYEFILYLCELHNWQTAHAIFCVLLSCCSRALVVHQVQIKLCGRGVVVVFRICSDAIAALCSHALTPFDVRLRSDCSANRTERKKNTPLAAWHAKRSRNTIISNMCFGCHLCGCCGCVWADTRYSQNEVPPSKCAFMCAHVQQHVQLQPAAASAVTCAHIWLERFRI